MPHTRTQNPSAIHQTDAGLAPMYKNMYLTVPCVREWEPNAIPQAARALAMTMLKQMRATTPACNKNQRNSSNGKCAAPNTKQKLSNPAPRGGIRAQRTTSTEARVGYDTAQTNACNHAFLREAPMELHQAARMRMSLKMHAFLPRC